MHWGSRICDGIAAFRRVHFHVTLGIQAEKHRGPAPSHVEGHRAAFVLPAGVDYSWRWVTVSAGSAAISASV